MKAVFDTKPTSIYDDEVTSHYQFPKRYLGVVEHCIGDRVVFRRPRADGGNLAYFATATVAQLEADTVHPGMTFARLVDFMQFDSPVPWTVEGRYWEDDLRRIPQKQVGANLRGRSVRLLTDADFAAILSAGLATTLNPSSAGKLGLSLPEILAAKSMLHDFSAQEQPRRIEQVLANRVIRDASFRGIICRAYDNRCAVTGLRILDGADNPEVQAAHIWSVADGGPDVVQNGIALSATIHWLFDRHLISITEDYTLIVAKDLVPDTLHSAFGQDGARLHLPEKASERPHPSFLEKHRAKFSAKNAVRRR